MNKLKIQMLTVLFFVSTGFSLDMTIPLVWKPADDLSEFQGLNLGRLPALRVAINGVNDSREETTKIGRNTENSETRFYLTKDNIPDWVTGNLIKLFSRIGIQIVSKNPDIIMNFTLLRFYVDEETIYKGDVGFRVSVMTPDGKDVWTGITSGNSRRWGRSFSKENYYECISNSLIECVKNLLNKEAFIAAINSSYEDNALPDSTAAGAE